MRWQKKLKPKIGEKRIVECFAFWPTECFNGFVWLEKYLETQQYTQIVPNTCIYFDKPFWQTIRREIKDKK